MIRKDGLNVKDIINGQPKGAGRFIRHGQILKKPFKQPEGTMNNVSYELGTILQLDKENCLLVASMDEQGGHDLSAGNDGFVFKKLSDIKPENAVTINRPVADYSLRPGKDSAYLAKYPAFGGFIPLGARLENGLPHPAEGTGFCLSECYTFLNDRSDFLFPPEGDIFCEIIQLKWDGNNLEVTTERLPSVIGGLAIFGNRLGTGIGFNACAHGKGLLFPLAMEKGIVVVNFQWNGSRWTPTDCSKPFITDYGHEMEPSIRKVDDILYVYTRGSGTGRLYRSIDGIVFNLMSEKENLNVPQILNKGLDDSLYIATNPGPGLLRNPLLAYPVNNNMFGEPAVIHDQGGIYTEDGEEIPFVDHAIGFNIYLGNRWRHIITYRVCDLKERSIAASLAASMKDLGRYLDKNKTPNLEKREYSGLYMAELEYAGVADQPYEFQ